MEDAEAPAGANGDLAPVITMPATTSSEDGDDLSKVYGSFTDPDSSSWTATVDYGDGSGVQALALSGKTLMFDHVYALSRFPEGASVLITVRVTDNQGAVGTRTAINTVVDASPKPSVADATLTATNIYTATGSFQDTGQDSGGTYSASVNYGDGTAAQDLVVIANTFALSHTYPLGTPVTTYRLVVTVTDSGGAQGDGKASITAQYAGLSRAAATARSGRTPAAGRGRPRSCRARRW